MDDDFVLGIDQDYFGHGFRFQYDLHVKMIAMNRVSHDNFPNLGQCHAGECRREQVEQVITLSLSRSRGRVAGP
jgi:hypothetical protein